MNKTEAEKLSKRTRLLNILNRFSCNPLEMAEEIYKLENYLKKKK